MCVCASTDMYTYTNLIKKTSKREQKWFGGYLFFFWLKPTAHSARIVNQVNMQPFCCGVVNCVAAAPQHERRSNKKKKKKKKQAHINDTPKLKEPARTFRRFMRKRKLFLWNACKCCKFLQWCARERHRNRAAINFWGVLGVGTH